MELHITELDVRACDANSACNEVALEKQAQVNGSRTEPNHEPDHEPDHTAMTGLRWPA